MGGTFSDLKAQFDPVNRKRKGDQFEIVCKWFLENDTGQYKQLLRRVWLWKDWPGNWGIDAGIDLVAEDTEGRLWAIQAKAYENTVTRTEVNKFLAEAGRFDFAYRMLMATTDKLSPTAQRTMEDLGVTLIGLTELEDFTEWPAKLTDLRPARAPGPRKPHDYQQDAIKDVIKGFKTADRGQLIMACGTGKTLTAWFIKENLAATRTLVLLPSLSLLKQTMKEWRTANIKRPFDALPVCSDETVALDEDAAISHTSHLGEPADTDPEVIAAFLRKRSGPRVVFATYQSSPQIAAAFALGRVPGFDLVIADEAHRIAGPVSSDFGTVLNSKAIKAKRRLFMTATPRYFTGRVLRAAKDVEYEVASMDDETKFGAVFHRLSFAEAIERDLLTDYQVAIIGVDDAMYRDWAERGSLVTLDGRKYTDARSLARQIGLAKAMRKFDLRRVISFHSRVKASKDFAASMPAVLDWMPVRQRPKGELWSRYASGEMPAGERALLIGHLKRLDDGQRGLLANARCLAEGVDVPALDGVAFIDPKRSEVDIVQAVGRAIRKSESKTIGTIVIPVFIDTDEDAEVALDSSVFKPVWDVIKALRAHDTELGEELDALRREMGRKGDGPRLPSKLYIDVPVTVSKDFAHAFEARLVDATTAPWEFWFGLLERYGEENKVFPVPQDHRTGDGFPLGTWVAKQRRLFATQRLLPERQQRLESVPGWSWNTLSDEWQRGYNHAVAYAAEHGHARAPRSCFVAEFPLGQWITTQRSNYNNGILSVERQDLLEALPGWSWDPHVAAWNEGYRKLAAFSRKHGGCRVSKTCVFEGFPLGTWVHKQRRNFAKGALSLERQRRLEKLPGWTWNARAESWEDSYRKLSAFVKTHGDARVPNGFETADGFRLWGWIQEQRTVYRKGMLSADRQRRLEQLPGWTWNPRANAQAESWEAGYKELSAYVEAYGDARVPKGFQAATGFPLGAWAARQRRDFKSGALAEERQQRLRQFPGWTWSTRADSWEDGYRRLVAYVDIHGDARVPRNYDASDGFGLARWISRQRGDFSKGELSEDRRRRLEKLPGWTWDVLADSWEDGFEALLSYIDEHGDPRVPDDYRTPAGFPLGRWVSHQRIAFGKDKLSAERRERLESLSGWVWDSLAQAWEEAFEALVTYVDEHGHARAPQRYSTDDGFQLGRWVSNQRTAYSKKKLDPERRQRLQSLAGWVWGIHVTADKN